MAKTTAKDSGFVAAVGKVGKAWNDARTAKDTGTSFEQEPIEDGTYVARLSGGRCGSDKNGNPYVAFDFTIDRGTFEGVRVSKFHSIASRGNRTVEQALQSLFIDLQRLDPETDYSETDAGEIEGVVEELWSDSPAVQIGVKNNGQFVNIYINKRVDEGEWMEGSPAEEDVTLEKGDIVMWQAPRMKEEAEFIVTSVSEAKETVSLKRDSDGKAFKSVSFEDLGW